MNSSSFFPSEQNSNKNSYNPMMLKAASMQLSFPQDQKGLEMFNIPEDYYTNMSPVANKKQKKKSVSPKFKVYNSYDIYGNEINNQIKRENYERPAMQDENSGMTILVDKENTYSRANIARPSGLRVQGAVERGSLVANKNPLLDVTPCVVPNKMEEENEFRAEVKE